DGFHRPVAGLRPLAEGGDRSAALTIVQLEFDVACATGAICQGQEADLGGEMFTLDDGVSRVAPGNEAVIHNLRVGFEYLCGDRTVFQFLAVLGHGKAVGVGVGAAEGQAARAVGPDCVRSPCVEVRAGTGDGDLDVHEEG